MKNRHEGLAEMKKDGVTYCNMFWLFMFGNVLGVLLEGTWCRLIFGHWETHVATIWGPFSLIYGVGAVMFYISGEKITLQPNTDFRQLFATAKIHNLACPVFCAISGAENANEINENLFAKYCSSLQNELSISSY